MFKNRNSLTALLTVVGLTTSLGTVHAAESASWLTVQSVRANVAGGVVFFETDVCAAGSARTGARPASEAAWEGMQAVALAALLSGKKVKVETSAPVGPSAYCVLESIRIAQ